MSRHRTDLVAFVFATSFLVCAGLAVGVRTGNLGLGASSPNGAWIAGAVLALAGAIGVVGTLSNVRRNASPAAPAPSPVPTSETTVVTNDAADDWQVATVDRDITEVLEEPGTQGHAVAPEASAPDDSAPDGV